MALSLSLETNCQYTLENSETRYVPTFTSYTDFDARDIKVLLTNDLMHAALSEGHCKASTISYIDKRGQKRKLFENSCSEIFEIEKQIGGAKEVKQLLKVCCIICYLDPSNSVNPFAPRFIFS